MASMLDIDRVLALITTGIVYTLLAPVGYMISNIIIPGYCSSDTCVSLSQWVRGAVNSEDDWEYLHLCFKDIDGNIMRLQTSWNTQNTKTFAVDSVVATGIDWFLFALSPDKMILWLCNQVPYSLHLTTSTHYLTTSTHSPNHLYLLTHSPTHLQWLLFIDKHFKADVKSARPSALMLPGTSQSMKWTMISSTSYVNLNRHNLSSKGSKRESRSRRDSRRASERRASEGRRLSRMRSSLNKQVSNNLNDSLFKTTLGRGSLLTRQQSADSMIADKVWMEDRAPRWIVLVTKVQVPYSLTHLLTHSPTHLLTHAARD